MSQSITTNELSAKIISSLSVTVNGENITEYLKRELQDQMIEVKSDIDSIKSLIPSQTSTSNQLADKDFVNSSIVTNTAYFKGTFNSTSELPTSRVTPNDYAFVIRTDAVGQTFYDRYKYTADGQWLFEYTINNSGFTAVQYAAINSGVTSSWIQTTNSSIANASLSASTALVNSSQAYSEAQRLGQLINGKSDISSVYSKSEIDQMIGNVESLIDSLS